MQSNDNAPKLKQKATAKPSTSAADPKATAAAAAKAATSSTDSKQRTIVALVRGLHDTGIRDLQSLHRPLLEWEDRRVLPTCKSTPNTSNRTLHRQCGTEMAPHGSLPRLVINIESSDAMPADVLNSGNRNTLSPSPTPTRSLTPELNGDTCSGSCSHHQEHSTTPNATRRFSHFNLALRRFSHIHVNVLSFVIFSPLFCSSSTPCCSLFGWLLASNALLLFIYITRPGSINATSKNKHAKQLFLLLVDVVAVVVVVVCCLLLFVALLSSSSYAVAYDPNLFVHFNLPCRSTSCLTKNINK